MRRPTQIVQAVAKRWGVSEGQVYTVVIGTVVALAAAVGGIPPTLADRVLTPTRRAQVTMRTPPVTSQVPSADEETAPAPELSPPPLLFPSAPPFTADAPPATAAPDRPAATPRPARLAPGGYRVFAAVPPPGAPQGLAIAPNGDVLVATNNGDGRGADGRPVVFAFGANGDAAPKRIVVDKVESGGGIHDLVLPPRGNGDTVYALASKPAAVLRVEVGAGRTSTHATIPNIPPCAAAVGQEPCELSPVDNAPMPVAGVFDTAGNLIVADSGQAALWRVKPDRSVSLFFKAPQFVTFDGLSGIAAGNANTLYLTVARTTTGAGAVYRLADGALSEIAQTGNDTAPRGIAVGRSGRLYVALSGTGRVQILGADGQNVGLLPSDPALAFDTPVRVAFGPTGLLVVEQVPSRAQGGRVVELGVDDEARPPA